MVELKDPSVEQVKELISSLTEQPMNKSMLVLKQLTLHEESELAGLANKQLSAHERDQQERKLLRPMYVLSVSEDMEGIKPLDKVRGARLTEIAGIQIPCSIKGYKIILVREHDVLTLIKA